jgi:hypothetical protein
VTLVDWLIVDRHPAERSSLQQPSESSSKIEQSCIDVGKDVAQHVDFDAVILIRTP